MHHIRYTKTWGFLYSVKADIIPKRQCQLSRNARKYMNRSDNLETQIKIIDISTFPKMDVMFLPPSLLVAFCPNPYSKKEVGWTINTIVMYELWNVITASTHPKIVTTCIKTKDFSCIIYGSTGYILYIQVYSCCWHQWRNFCTFVTECQHHFVYKTSGQYGMHAS